MQHPTLTLGRIVALILATSVVHAQGLIDFESIPGGVPVDGLSISNQFEPTHGVTFSLADGNSPVLGEIGPPRTAFSGYQGMDDEPAPGSGVGQFFLSDDGTVVGVPSTLIITYSSPVAAATGIILDVDGLDEWTIEALTAGGVVADTVILGPNPTLDGSASTWSFSLAAAVISSIEVSYSGTALGPNVGLAFDRFNASAVAPGTGQSNSSLARLEVNGVGSGTGNGPFDVFMDAGGTMTLDWSGPAGGPLILAGGPSNPGHIDIPCHGILDIGTPPWSDIFVLFDGLNPPLNFVFTLDSTGTASQTFSLPGLPPGPLFAVQGFVYQPGGNPCFVILTASFRLGIN